ncbi:lipopolysaccharide biosynthesis protein [Dietzia cercidiphylli]|uniref:lipopolysaccharide biosynthesis protein n=1 Tax=Dietzia cercidiphylli TaxID=498199 RepID=UPI003F7D6966
MAVAGTSAEVGRLTAPLALASVFFVFLSFGMRNVYLTHDTRLSIRWYMKHRIRLLTLALVLCLLLAFALGSYELSILLLVCVTKFIEAVADLLFVADQETKRQGLVGVVMILLGVGSAAGFIAGYALSDEIVIGQLGWIGANGIVVAIYFVYVRRRYGQLYFGPDHGVGSETGHRVLIAGASLGAAQVTATIQSSAPVLFLNQFSTPAQVGAFSLVFYFFTIFSLGASSLQQQALPGIKAEQAAGVLTVRFRFSLIGLSVAVAAGAIVLGSAFLKYVYRTDVEVSRFTFVALGVAIVAQSLSLFVGTRLSVFQHYSAQLVTGAIGTAVTVLVCLALSGRLTIESAMASVALGFVVRAIGNIISAQLFKRSGSLGPG